MIIVLKFGKTKKIKNKKKYPTPPLRPQQNKTKQNTTYNPGYINALLYPPEKGDKAKIYCVSTKIQ